MKSNIYLSPSTYDFVLDGGFNLRVTTTFTEWLSQKIENKLKTLYGEFFADYTLGIPYYQSILVKNPNITQVNTIFRKAILDIDEVSSISSMTIDFDTSIRKYTISNLVVVSTEGETVTIDTVTS